MAVGDFNENFSDEVASEMNIPIEDKRAVKIIQVEKTDTRYSRKRLLYTIDSGTQIAHNSTDDADAIQFACSSFEESRPPASNF